MTYCAAWKSGECAFLISDALVTAGRPPVDSTTSFNESYRQLGRDYVEERLLKIHEIRPGVACAIAGDVALAQSLVEFIAEHFDQFESPRTVLDALSVNLGPFDPSRAAELLLVASKPDTETQVLAWNTVTPQAVHVGEIHEIGSLGASHRQLTRDGVEYIRRRGVSDPQRELVTIIAAVQSYGQHSDLIGQHVGGVISGLWVRNGGTHWQQDTTTVFLNADQTFAGIVSTHFRDGGLIINSTHISDGLALLGWGSREGGVQRAEQWFDRWVKPLSNYAETNVRECRNWIFQRLDAPVVSIVCANRKIGSHRDPFKIEPTPQLLQISFDPAFLHHIHRSSAHSSMPGLDLSLTTLA